MCVKWVCSVILVLGAVAAESIPDELYYRAPRMFQLDDYNKCHFQDGTFCMGEFEITPAEGGEQLYRQMLKVSESGFRFNRSKIFRGVCLSWCDKDEQDPATKFVRCVDQNLLDNYRLRAHLLRLNYCKTKETGTRPKDFSDWLLAVIVVLILVLNVVGTLYDYKKDPTIIPNKFLMAWSLRENWKRLTAVYSGDQKLDALAPIHGIKAHMIMLVVFSHTTFGLTMVYPSDERVLDDNGDSLNGSLSTNGTMTVQTFTMISSFLLGYMILTNFDKAKKTPSIKYWPAIVFSRYMRMAPLTMLVVGLTATWAARLSQGPMWYLVEELEAACRKKWWAQLLFINNFVFPDDRCLVQSWFFAVEMQLFLGAVALALLLAPRPRRALRVLGALYAAALAVNFSLNLAWGMVPVVKFGSIDNVRTMAVGIDSYVWMFSATWTSIPSTLHGLFLAFLKYNLEKSGFKAEKHKWIGKLLWLMGLLMTVWMLSGHFVKDIDDPFWLAVFATIDRNIWNIMVTYLVFAYIHGYGGLVIQYLRWGGFQIMGRVVFPIMLIHWHINLMSPASSPIPVFYNIYHIVLHFFSGLVMSTLLAVPLHLLAELPMQKMLS
ncbi:nose resistant to fluoxetine protein 6-like [Plodia interpunctella]|uniref:nose resistant to fluoxetine protein 6-like n=1 Tax=Plodia interpunctella TaxID=58824 RepID=UPI0023680673|nr:nose resistant to fluoxetine protein 6-like [Plodia interpunctella]